MASYTQDDIDSLAAKLAAAELTDGEQAVLYALVHAADGDDEVDGFGMGLSFAPLKPAEFLLAHELTHVRHDTAKARGDGPDGVVFEGGGSGI